MCAGKLGVGAVYRSGAALQPGGGSGFLPTSGDYNITLYTNHSDVRNRFTLAFVISSPKPSLVVKGPRAVTGETTSSVHLIASEVRARATQLHFCNVAYGRYILNT